MFDMYEFRFKYFIKELRNKFQKSNTYTICIRVYLMLRMHQ